MATVTVAPTSPVAASSSCVVTVDAAAVNATGTPDPAVYPAQAEKRYYLTFEEGGAEKGRSYVFGVDAVDGGHVFSGYVFPDAGTYVVHLRDVADDSSVADSGNVTVQ
jgi:hypothetical protein